MTRFSAHVVGRCALTILLAGCAPAVPLAPSVVPTPPATAAAARSIVGTWRCGPPDAPGQDVVEIRADGTVTITQPQGTPGTTRWSFDGLNGAFETPEGADRFRLEDGRIIFGDGFSCTAQPAPAGVGLVGTSW